MNVKLICPYLLEMNVKLICESLSFKYFYFTVFFYMYLINLHLSYEGIAESISILWNAIFEF